MELTVIMLRTLLMYLFVYVILRMMGKREIGKLSVFDLVISIMIAEIAVIAIESPHPPVLHAVAPMAVLVVAQLIVSNITLKNRRLRLWFEGKPSVIISQGDLNWKEMKKQRYSLDDLMMQLRENRIDHVADVELAVLESSGKLSVIVADKKKQDAADSRGESAKPKIRYGLLPLPLIMDGLVQDDSLERIGKNRFWLRQELRKEGVKDFKQVAFCSMDHKGRLYINRRK
ncbi:DUF421 domain-containing protein [Cohnella sp. JJ-181]|uniref:DUF421 domain-containing protein n=1 Tax=Cohnella rhizoplanae TaxID=2974897 RepID=UPI0023304E48|nr:DUF421 domain-containing protein [Cohnella sp. JJ-181]